MKSLIDQERLRAAFHSANAIVALAGWVPPPDALATRNDAIARSPRRFQSLGQYALAT